jgi:chitinase
MPGETLSFPIFIPMKQLNKSFFVLMLSVLVVVACKKSDATVNQPTTLTNLKAPANFKVVGYMLTSDIASGQALNFNFSRINYLNIAFINPDESGNFGALNNLAAVIAAAHKSNVKVLVSIGGGNAPAYFSRLLADTMRVRFEANLMALVSEDGFDGIDVDLEGQRIDNNYEAFVSELSTALIGKKMLLTAAIATGYKDSYTDKALSYFDFVNVMSYDKTGPWAPNLPGQDAPYDMAVSDLQYWNGTRGIDKSRLNLGLPVYGYDFEQGGVYGYTYATIVGQFTGSENTDQVATTTGGTIYYNGIPTIQAKTKLALQNAGGVMLWQIMGDANGSKSLLNAINQIANPTNK